MLGVGIDVDVGDWVLFVVSLPQSPVVLARSCANAEPSSYPTFPRYSVLLRIRMPPPPVFFGVVTPQRTRAHTRTSPSSWSPFPDSVFARAEQGAVDAHPLDPPDTHGAFLR